MRIIFFVGEFSEGGAERVISILANKLIEKGFDIEILKYHNSDNFYKTNEKIKITSVEENTNTRSNIIKNLVWMHKHFKENADIIISFLAPFNILAIVANFFNNIPIIVADRNDPNFTPNKKYKRVLRNILYNFADKVVVQTKHNKEYFSKAIQKKTSIIFNPIEIGDNSGLALRSKKENLIVSVGRLEKQKNQEMLIKVFSDINKDYPEYKLIIYGEGSSRQELELLIKNLKLTNVVSLPGNTKDILNKINGAKIFVLTSNYEGMSNALIEAMCIGLPVISTRVSGTEDLIIDDVNGLLIDINDYETLKKDLKVLLNDESKANSLGLEATKIIEKLNTDSIVDSWISLINKCKK